MTDYMKEIQKLYDEIQALRTIQIPGGTTGWTSWTPTITYLGGTTNPTSLSVISARYSRVGKTTTVTLVGSLTRGAGDRTDILFTLPFNYIHDLSFASFITFNGVITCPAFGNGATRVNVYTAGMATDGNMWLSGSYESV